MPRSAAALVGLVALLSACATIPAKPIADLKDIAGKWTGTFTSPQGEFPVELTIKTDGTWEAEGSGGVVPGTLRVSGGKALWRNSNTGRTGAWTLRESPDGRRMLTSESDDRTSTAEYTPAH